MHVLHRPHLPRHVSLSVVAAILAIAISFALAHGLSTLSQPGSNRAAGPQKTTVALTGAQLASAAGWTINPFAGLLTRPLPQPWLTPAP
jgi:hypothetical protein